jgi:hypothetical protein
MGPTLAAAGFTHRRNPMEANRREDDFVRPLPNSDLAHVISTQETQYASDTCTRWTVITALYVPELRAIRSAPPDDHIPCAGDCFGSARIGELLRADEDFWYQLGSDGVPEALGAPPPRHPTQDDYAPLRPPSVRRALLRDLEQVILPYLAPLTDRAALYRHFTGPRAPRSAGILDRLALELALGKLDEAQGHLAQLPDRPDLRAYARTHYGLKF